VRLLRPLGGVRRDSGIERFALPHRGVERAHRLLERRLGVEAVGIEDVDVVEPHPGEALVEACEQVLPRAPDSIRARPHVVARLRRDHELVAVRIQVLLQQHSEVLLGRAVRRAVVVRQIEVRHAEIECTADDRAARLERAVVPEVLPEAERDRRELEPAPAAAAVEHSVITLVRSDVRHGAIIPAARPPMRQPHAPLGQAVAIASGACVGCSEPPSGSSVIATFA
jgi:hypothetical protein